MKNEEHKEQVALMKWVDLAQATIPELRCLFAVPNGGWRRIGVAVKLKAEGVRAGVPDIMLAVSRGNYHGLFIEMKKRVGGRVAPDQAVWLKRLMAQGYACRVSLGWGDAKDTIINYLKGQEISCYPTKNPKE